MTYQIRCHCSRWSALFIELGRPQNFKCDSTVTFEVKVATKRRSTQHVRSHARRTCMSRFTNLATEMVMAWG